MAVARSGTYLLPRGRHNPFQVWGGVYYKCIHDALHAN